MSQGDIPFDRRRSTQDPCVTRHISRLAAKIVQGYYGDRPVLQRIFPFHNRGALCSGCVPAAKGMRSSAAVQGESRCKRPACDTDRTACCRREREDRNPFDEPDHLLPAESGYMCKAFSRLRGVDPNQLFGLC
jgi:hypothetical protein